MNNAELMGRLVRDPYLSVSQSQIATAKFTLAVDRKMSKEKKKEAEQNRKPTADFIPVILWGKKAELANQYLRKGCRVAISGTIRTGSYKDKDDITRYTTEIYATDIDFIDYANQQQSNNGSSNDYTMSDVTDDDNDIPF